MEDDKIIDSGFERGDDEFSAAVESSVKSLGGWALAAGVVGILQFLFDGGRTFYQIFTMGEYIRENLFSFVIGPMGFAVLGFIISILILSLSAKARNVSLEKDRTGYWDTIMGRLSTFYVWSLILAVFTFFYFMYFLVKELAF